MQARLLRALEIAVLLGALMTIPLVLIGEGDPTPVWVQVADWAVWGVFVIEYVVMLVLAERRLQYVKSNPLNLIVIVLSYPVLPGVFGLTRAARLVRFFRVLRLVSVTARGIQSLRTVAWCRGLAGVCVVSSLVIVAGGTALTVLEPQTVRGGYADGIWWAIVTASTVGYGDISPTTLLGRSIAVSLMLCGVGLISTLAASITAYFVGQEESAALVELRERTARMEAMLTELLEKTGAEKS